MLVIFYVHFAIRGKLSITAIIKDSGFKKLFTSAEISTETKTTSFLILNIKVFFPFLNFHHEHFSFTAEEKHNILTNYLGKRS